MIIYGVPDVLTTGREDPLAKTTKAGAKKKRATAKKSKKSAPKSAAKKGKAASSRAKPKSRAKPAARSPRAGRRAKAAGPQAKAGPAELTPRAVQDAVDRARGWLAERRDLYGYFSRRDSGRGAPELAGHLRGDLRAKQGPDGSWQEGDLGVSVEALWRLLDLGQPGDSPVVGKALDWLYSRRDVDGAYGSGCTPARHEARLCQHYIAGFFSPGGTDEPQEITLDNGQTVNSDAGARLLMSERALRAALRARPHDPRAGASVSGLRSLPVYLEYGGNYTPAVLVGALQALAWHPCVRSAELEAGLESLSKAQEQDGTWPNVEFFFVLETLLEVKHPVSEQLIMKAALKLLETQHKYGAWGRRHLGSQTWIAMQALERVLEIQRRSR